MTETIQWGLLATGSIAHAFASGLAASRTGNLAAVGSRFQEKSDAFAAEFGGARAHGSYDALLADDGVQAVYVSTPHPYHAEWTIRALEAGKHVLVEKPIGLHEYEAQAMIEAAVKSNRFLMEAYMYRCHPQTARLVELIKDHVIGDVRVIKATFSFNAGFNAESRLWSNQLAGGGILDVGGYTTSISRLVAGAALGKPFADPIGVTGSGHLHPETGVDAWAVGTLAFENDIMAGLFAGIGVNQKNDVQIFGTKGWIEVPNPYTTNREGGAPGMIIVHSGGNADTIEIESPVTSFTHEADVVGTAIAHGRQESDAMPWADTLGNIRTQDSWRNAIGLVYESEKPNNVTQTISRRPLVVRDDAVMTYGKVRHLDKPMPHLVMGVDNQTLMRHAAAVFDEYFERGGTAFDTAWIYGKAISKVFGQWITNRGVREDVAFIAKGAHTPDCYPTALITQFNERPIRRVGLLERLHALNLSQSQLLRDHLHHQIRGQHLLNHDSFPSQVGFERMIQG